ncbi:MAG: hypothetical protein U1A78_23590 [Polyangia bacterium]
MSRQTPDPVSVVPSPSSRVHHTAPGRAGRLLAACALLGASTGCFGKLLDWEGSASVQLPQRLAAVGEEVAVRSSACAADWEVSDVPSGEASRGARVRGGGESATFLAEQPGEYEITARCRKSRASSRIVAFSPTVTLRLGGPVTLPIKCQDAVAGPRGRLLCVDHGVHVVEPASGRVLGRTAAPLPATWGLDAQGDRFVVATLGCPSTQAGCPTPGLEKGVYLYRLGGDDQPVELGRIAGAAELVPLLDSDRLFVSTDQKVQRYTIADPTMASAAGCLADESLGTVPLPFRVGDKLAVLTWKDRLQVYDPATLPPSCTTPTKPLAEARLYEKDSGVLFYSRPAVSGGIAYVAGVNGLLTLDLTDPLRPRISDRLKVAAGSVVLVGGRLLALADGGVLALELSDPLHPRPAGRVPVAEGFHVFDRLVALGDELWIVVDSTVRRVELR